MILFLLLKLHPLLREKKFISVINFENDINQSKSPPISISSSSFSSTFYSSTLVSFLTSYYWAPDEGADPPPQAK